MSEIKNTRWKYIYQSQDVVTLGEKDRLQHHGDPAAYKYMSIPPFKSALWKDAPTDDNGNLNFSEPSRITGYGHGQRPYPKVDFTYFRTTVDIPEGSKITSFKVRINNVDDGARIFLFNNTELCSDGFYDPSDDVKLNGKVVVDFSNQVLIGGVNTIVVVQFDDCPVLNTLKGGIDIIINGTTITTCTDETSPSCLPPEDDGIKWKYYWATGLRTNPQNVNEALGVVDGNSFTYKSNVKAVVKPQLHFGYQNLLGQTEFQFPPLNKTNCINNTEVSDNTLTFTNPIKDPIVVFGSIGSAGRSVPVKFYNPIEILWSERVTVSGQTITGTEGNAIIKIPGTYSEIRFEYLVAESSVDFFFGHAKWEDS